MFGHFRNHRKYDTERLNLWTTEKMTEKYFGRFMIYGSSRKKNQIGSMGKTLELLTFCQINNWSYIEKQVSVW